MTAPANFPEITLTGPITTLAEPLELTTIRLQNRFVLPPSYRDFATRFGYGRLFDRLILYIPMGDHPDSLQIRSRELGEFFIEGIENEYFEYEPDGSPDLIRRLVPFGISEVGHFFGWDPLRPTGAGEYGIYAIGSKMLSVTYAAGNLYEFLWGCTTPRVKQILGPGYEPLKAVFAPATK